MINEKLPTHCSEPYNMLSISKKLSGEENEDIEKYTFEHEPNEKKIL